MVFPRTAGLLLHPTSLPSIHGVGDFGPEARRFVQWLKAAGQTLWQVLPLGPTGYGDSPYQCLSAFAGNTLLVSLEDLVEDGWLETGDLTGAPAFPIRWCDFGAVIDYKRRRLARAYERFELMAGTQARHDWAAFCEANAFWLDDYALFLAAKDRHGGRAWTEWDSALARRNPQALGDWRNRCAREVRTEQFAQWQFYLQWGRLREHCRAAGLHLMGDLPIFVAHDSADVWSHPEFFRLAEDGRPTHIAGVPPDYFSATGQCWGNPLYRWEEFERTQFAWWVARFRQSFATFDWLRVDHFRGFEAFWEIPGTDTTAVNGRWVKGPGAPLFETIRRSLGELPIIAENLGVITREVEAIRERFGFPGMAILQFAFGTDPQGPTFRPHNHCRELVVYTGTHDNDTIVGWWTSTGTGDSTRTAKAAAAEKEFALRYLGSDGSDIHWAVIRAALASVAKVAIVPLQDILGLGSEARMNFPARPFGNWSWRFAATDLTEAAAARLRDLSELYDRSQRTTA